MSEVLLTQAEPVTIWCVALGPYIDLGDSRGKVPACFTSVRPGTGTYCDFGGGSFPGLSWCSSPAVEWAISFIFFFLFSTTYVLQ